MSKIKFPKDIIVGFQNRKDTFSGKLAYVTYWHNKEKENLRAERSWQGWRDKTIEPLEFENLPRDGFVLNKDVKRYTRESTWRGLRVHDPDGFEFEMNSENLSYLVKYTNILKGGIFDGDFVYGWHGKDVWLIPVDSPDYKNHLESKEKTTKNVYSRDNKPKAGHLYKFKDDTASYHYLGYRKVYFFNKSKNYHCWVKVSDSSFVYKTGYTYIEGYIGESLGINYVDIENQYLSKPVSIDVNGQAGIDIKHYKRLIVKHDGSLYYVFLVEHNTRYALGERLYDLYVYEVRKIGLKDNIITDKVISYNTFDIYTIKELAKAGNVSTSVKITHESGHTSTIGVWSIYYDIIRDY